MDQLKPADMVRKLDKYIIGQNPAKRSVAIALRNRWRRQHVREDLRDEIAPKNIILIGPTGVGKTEIARRISLLADSPFYKVEASKFTEVGYVGREVDSIIRDLVDISIKTTREQELEKVRHLAEDAVEERGFLAAENMFGAFNSLRSTDLIWSFVINHYLLGKPKPVAASAQCVESAAAYPGGTNAVGEGLQVDAELVVVDMHGRITAFDARSWQRGSETVQYAPPCDVRWDRPHGPPRVFTVSASGRTDSSAGCAKAEAGRPEPR